MRSDTPLGVVRAWLEAVNAQDVERVLALSDPELEIVGPRGTARGHPVLRDWLGRAGVTLETRRAFARGDAVVVAQRGVWRSAETGGEASGADVASRFRVADGRVTQYARHERLEDALREAGLSEGDEVRL